MRKIAFIIALLITGVSLYGQYTLEEEKPGFAQRLRFGGGIGLNFGDITYINISPRVSYLATERLTIGTGGSYMFYKNKYYNYQNSIFGASVYSGFAIIKNIGNIFPGDRESGSVLAYAEAKALNLDPDMDFTKSRDERFWLMQPMAGVGFKIPAGIDSYALILFLYNFNEQIYSPAQNPVINVSLMF